MKSYKSRKFLSILGAASVCGVLSLAFQNCSRAGFEANPNVMFKVASAQGSDGHQAGDDGNIAGNSPGDDGRVPAGSSTNNPGDDGQTPGSSSSHGNDGNTPVVVVTPTPKPAATPTPTPTPVVVSTPKPASPCVFNGQTIADGQTITAWSSPAGSRDNAGYLNAGSCTDQQRTCKNGVLSGSSIYKYSACTVTYYNWKFTGGSAVAVSPCGGPGSDGYTCDSSNLGQQVTGGNYCWSRGVFTCKFKTTYFGTSGIDAVTEVP